MRGTGTIFVEYFFKLINGYITLFHQLTLTIGVRDIVALDMSIVQFSISQIPSLIFDSVIRLLTTFNNWTILKYNNFESIVISAYSVTYSTATRLVFWILFPHGLARRHYVGIRYFLEPNYSLCICLAIFHLICI